MLKKIESAISAEKKIKVKSQRDKDDGREYQIMAATPALQKEPYTTFMDLSLSAHVLIIFEMAMVVLANISSGYTCTFLKLDRDDKLLQQTSLTVGELTRLLAIDKIDEESEEESPPVVTKYASVFSKMTRETYLMTTNGP